MRSLVTSDNFTEVARKISSSQESEFDFTGSTFNTPESIRQIFTALCYLPQAIKVKFHDCIFNEDSDDFMRELRVNLVTAKNIRELEITGLNQKGNMEYLVSGLCRNHSLRCATLDGVSPDSPAVIDLSHFLAKVSVNGEEIFKH